MHSLNHDPRTKQNIRDMLHEYLYSPLEEYFRKKRVKIIKANTIRGGFDHPHFQYKGEFYTMTEVRPSLKKNPLLPEFHAQMDDYLAEFRHIHLEEFPLTLGYITTVLNSSNHYHDYYRLLPEVLHPPLQGLATSCPYQTGVLEHDKVVEIVQKNEKIYNMIKARRVMNTLLPP